jgi:hypothetical protein
MPTSELDNEITNLYTDIRHAEEYLADIKRALAQKIEERQQKCPHHVFKRAEICGYDKSTFVCSNCHLEK